MSQTHLIIHIPHCAIDIPLEIRQNLLLSDSELDAEILEMTDWYTDELAVGLENSATIIANQHSRLVVDPERFRDDAVETMSQVGMGAVYVRTSDGKPLRRFSAGIREQLLRQYYDPYHEHIDAVTADILADHGRCLIVDLHSFPSKSLPYESDPNALRPDICIGTDDFHTPAALAAFAENYFAGAGFNVAFNTPYSGTIVPGRFYLQDKRVSSVMIEIKRSLYMNEKTGEKIEGFQNVKRVFNAFVKMLADRFDSDAST